MIPYFKTQNLSWLLFLTLLNTSLISGQKDVEKWKLQVALGVNNPIDDNDPTFFTEYINFPTINLGLQHMFSRNFGAKLDLGYNRASEGTESLPFKLNYTRINVQAVYDFKDVFKFWPDPIGIVAHAGPGLSMTKPLSPYANNTYSYPNVLAGLEVHYRLTESLSIYVDGSYALSLSRKEKYPINTFSFNGDLMYVTFGAAISLDGCHYCN
ncbi:MAG: cell envelope biogenesis protein OmpA [Gelidibacter sp.]